MNTLLVIVTVVEVLLLVVVLAGYLIAIASMLSRTLQSLKLITIGVKAIDSQVEPIASDVRWDQRFTRAGRRRPHPGHAVALGARPIIDGK